jgi:uncharacterized protein (UPF0218 family)
LIIPDELKEKLREPFGKVYSSIEEIQLPKGTRLITVGDRASYSAITSGIFPDIIVYDGKEKRNFDDSSVKETLDGFSAEKFVVHNPPGQITEDLWNCVKKYSKKSKIKIFVIGEDDLAVIPFIMESSENTVILYGNFKGGIVLVKVNENIKKIIKDFIDDATKGP